MKKLIFIAILMLSIAGYGMFEYGRGLWFPYYVKVTGGKSMDEVIAELGKRYAGPAEEVESLILYAMKEERMLEVWGVRSEGALELLKSYPN